MGRILLFVIVALLLAPVVVPPFLDRIYYTGPVTDHFDGARFRNPEGEPIGGGQRRNAAGWLAKMALGRDARTPWPDHLPVTPGYPPAAGTPCPIEPPRVREAWARCSQTVDPRRMFVTWIGHSTVLVQAGGLAILTDPIWSDRASPVGFAGPKRVRAPGIRFEDLPKIDLVLVSHDHYDHMDMATLRALAARDHPLIVTSLGNDALMRAHGVTGAVARDWGGRVGVRPGIDVIVERVHHWGSRWGSDRDRALWSGFTVTLPGGNLFFAGDTGWGDGAWVGAAARHGPFRLALIPIGAYQPARVMRSNHIGPEEAVNVFRGLGAAYALGVHWGTFRLSAEGPDEPPQALGASLSRQGIPPGRFRTLTVGRPWEVPAR